MTDTEVTNSAAGAPAGEFPDLGAKSPEKKREPKANFPKDDRRNGNGGRKGGGRDQRQDISDVTIDTPLVKPKHVPRPDEGMSNDKMVALREKIEEEEKRVTTINEEIERMKEVRGEGNVEQNAVRATLRDHRQKIRDQSSARDRLMDELKKASEAMKSHDKKAQALRKDNKSLDLAEIDSLIAAINYKLESSSMDLKTEKEQIREMKKLSESKAKVSEYEAEKNAASAAREKHDALYVSKQAAQVVINELRDQDKVIAEKLDAFRTAEGPDGSANPSVRITELLDEKAKVIAGIKEIRGQIKDVNISYKIMVAEHREFERAVQAYERKAGRVEYLKRKQEYEGRKEQQKVEKKEWDTKKKEERKKMDDRMRKVADGFQLYVSGLQLRVEEAALIKHFSSFGTITDAFVVKDNDTQLCARGFGFVTFDNEESAAAAIKGVSGQEVAGLAASHQRLSVKKAGKSKMQDEWENRNLPKKKKEPEEKKGAKDAADGAAPEGAKAPEGAAAGAKEREAAAEAASAPAAQEGKAEAATATDEAKPAAEEPEAPAAKEDKTEEKKEEVVEEDSAISE
mmetsp:Transcript_5608/g.13615  ORF Transcript_5608/g.13615 Transcript_5608/m.13615 type:complete len:571 (-) Transcript_5608:126-1838(-)